MEQSIDTRKFDKALLRKLLESRGETFYTGHENNYESATYWVIYPPNERYYEFSIYVANSCLGKDVTEQYIGLMNPINRVVGGI